MCASDGAVLPSGKESEIGMEVAHGVEVRLAGVLVFVGAVLSMMSVVKTSWYVKGLIRGAWVYSRRRRISWFSDQCSSRRLR